MKQLSVMFCGWGANWHLGTLAHSGRHLLFEYSAEALARQVQVSPLKLRLQQQAYSGFADFQDGLPGVIADALPDGWGRLLMDRCFAQTGRRLDTISPLDRLAFIADRAMGALSFVPADTLQLDALDKDLLALAQAAQLVLQGEDTQALRELAITGGSPQGARPKVLVQYEEDRRLVHTSPDAPGEPWLVKFQAAHEHKEVCALEDLYASLARDSGLDMPRTRYFELDNRLSGFGIARFDRVRGMRVPMLTLAGLLDNNFRIPSLDYADLLRATRFLTRDERDVEQAYARCVFNVLFNNRDDHSKNFSFLLDESLQWRLAPAYDLTYNAGINGWHQMLVAGEGVAPKGSTLAKLAKDNGVNAGAARRIVERVATVASGFAAAAKERPIRRVTLQTVGGFIQANLARIGM